MKSLALIRHIHIVHFYIFKDEVILGIRVALSMYLHPYFDFQLAVVITDGKQTKTGKFTALSVASRGIKSKGVIVYAVGVGTGVDRTELEEIASDSQHVFISSSFSELHAISLGLTRRLCEGEGVHLYCFYKTAAFSSG